MLLRIYNTLFAWHHSSVLPQAASTLHGSEISHLAAHAVWWLGESYSPTQHSGRTSVLLPIHIKLEVWAVTSVNFVAFKGENGARVLACLHPRSFSSPFSPHYLCGFLSLLPILRSPEWFFLPHSLRFFLPRLSLPFFSLPLVLFIFLPGHPLSPSFLPLRFPAVAGFHIPHPCSC